MSSPSCQTIHWAWVLPIASLTVASTYVGHLDAGDADTYRVVIRNLVEDGTWLRTRYVPGAQTPFFEHLPFGFWPFAAGQMALGDAGQNLIAWGMTLLTLWVVHRGARVAGAPAEGAWIAALILALTPTFFSRGGQPFLDVPLVLFSTAAVLPLLRPMLALRDLAWTVPWLAAAVAVKGPFGLVPFLSVALARAVLERAPKLLWLAGVASLAAVLPVALFLTLSPQWRQGYLEHQLLASAVGTRRDGQMTRTLYPFVVWLGNFWPGVALIPFAVVAMLQERRRRGPMPRRPGPVVGGSSDALQRALVLGLASLIALAVLCLPARKFSHHVLVVFPLTAMFLGAALGARVRQWTQERPRTINAALVGLCALAAGLFVTGAGRKFFAPPCVASVHFAEEMAQLEPGEPVLVSDVTYQWKMIASLGAHYRVVPVLLRPETQSLREDFAHARWTLSSDGTCGAEGWVEVKTGGGWTLCERKAEAR